jgi:MFS transporter, OPA family, glycerol-3-phosphate transporter
MTAHIQKNSTFERWRWQVFAITWLAYFAYYFTRKAFSVAKLGISEDPSLDISKEMMANIDGMYLAGYALGHFFWGVLADRFGPRVVVLGGLFISILAASVMGLFPAAMLFLVVSGVHGVAQATGWSSLCKNVSSFFSISERGRVMGFWCTNYSVGGLLATPFASWWAYEYFEDWRVAFFAPAVVVAMVWVLFFLFQRNRPQDVGLPSIDEYHKTVHAESAKADTQSAPAEPFWSGIKEVLSNKTIVLLACVYALLKPARYAILFWGPFIIYEQLEGVNKLTASTVPIAFELAGIMGPILIGYASDKYFNSRRMPVCIISLLLLSIVLAAFIPVVKMGGIWPTVIVLFLIGLTLYGPDSMVSGTAAVDFGSRKGAGTATGFINGCGSMGAVLGGILPGYFDVLTVFFGFAVVNLLAALMLIPLWNRLPKNGGEDGCSAEVAVATS